MGAMSYVLTPILGMTVPTWVPPVLTVALLLASLFLIGLVLIQRGKGGGLAGAFGGAGGQSYSSDVLQLAIELRAVNNRYLKVTLRAVEPYNLLEAEVEKVVRRSVKRGTLQVHLRCTRRLAAQDFQINTVALKSYVEQVHRLCGEMGLPGAEQTLLGQALALPGVVPEPANASLNLEEEWPTLERVLEQALTKLQTM